MTLRKQPCDAAFTVMEKHMVGHSLYCVVIDIMKFRVFWHVALCSDVEMD
jgi:hypothetical protein